MLTMGAYILKRILLMIPTLARHHADDFYRHSICSGRAH